MALQDRLDEVSMTARDLASRQPIQAKARYHGTVGERPLMSTEPEAPAVAGETAAEETPTEEKKESSTLKVITWLSVGMAVAALGIFVGRELRNRYKFNHRTPYDFYDHASGNEQQTGEAGLGV